MLREGIRMRRIRFVRHCTARQIRAKDRACRHPVEEVRWHAARLPAWADDPRTPARVADVVGLSDVAARAVLHRWNAPGPARPADGRGGNGSEPGLTTRRRGALSAAVRKRPRTAGGGPGRGWPGPSAAAGASGSGR